MAKLDIWNERMLKLMDYCLIRDPKATEHSFLHSIEFTNPNNLKQVKEKKQSFRHHHFLNAAKIYNVSMDWFYGLTNRMERKKEDVNAIDLIRQGLILLENNKPGR